MVSKKQGAGKKTTTEAAAPKASKSKGTKTAVDETATDSVHSDLLAKGQTANESAVHKALGLFGLARADTLAKNVTKLREHLAERFETVVADDRIKCDACGEISTEDTSFCPYCGDEGDAEAAEPAAAATPADKLAKDVEAGLEAKATELDARRDRIRELAANLSGNSYDLGLEIKAVYDAELWKAKGHKSFKDWYETEIGMSKTVAYRLMDMVHQFDRATFLKAGPSKLALVATIEDKATREEALEAAKEGATKRKIEDIAKKKDGGEKGGKEASSAGAEKPKKEDGKITLLGKIDGKPTTYQFRSARTGKPVKKHGEDSYVEIRLSETVVQRIALKVDANGEILGVTAAFTRADAEAAAAE